MQSTRIICIYALTIIESRLAASQSNRFHELVVSEIEQQLMDKSNVCIDEIRNESILDEFELVLVSSNGGEKTSDAWTMRRITHDKHRC